MIQGNAQQQKKQKNKNCSRSVNPNPLLQNEIANSSSLSSSSHAEEKRQQNKENKEEESKGDFHLFELVDQHELLAKEESKESFLKGYPKLRSFYENVLALDELKEYFASDLYALNCNNVHAGWQGKKKK